MLANANTVLIGKKVALVPYEAEHVPKYHAWMQDEEIRRLTASEPLSLEEEYSMQQKWRNDEDKLTFIVLARDCINDEETETDTALEGQMVNLQDNRIHNLPMVGDVNLFFSGVLGSGMGDSAHEEETEEEDEFTAEAEIMIAEPAFRRKGLAQEALQLMFQYATGLGAHHFTLSGDPVPERNISIPSLPNLIPPRSLLCRISEDNQASIRLFEKLGFKITKHVQVFGEIEMRWSGRAQVVQ
ncbi:hypothetical protein VNI00_005368 [Paramarasmius palmivorus]|uniref:N-acetyltransferase domain-containing protein n=1 Tax=Paramarasmius palmivorus TaxID=297713 RepID=A0AAW0DB72_9AGAR